MQATHMEKSPVLSKKGRIAAVPFNALDPIGAMPLQDYIGNKTPSCSFYVKHFI